MEWPKDLCRTSESWLDLYQWLGWIMKNQGSWCKPQVLYPQASIKGTKSQLGGRMKEEKRARSENTMKARRRGNESQYILEREKRVRK